MGNLNDVSLGFLYSLKLSLHWLNRFEKIHTQKAKTEYA